MRALFFLLAFAVAGCGFSPLYAPPPGGGPVIGAVSIGTIPGKAGHVLRNELTRMLAAEGADGPAQPLEIALRERVSRLGLRTDESASRADLTLTARYTLTPPQGRPVRGTVQSVATYVIPTAAFAEIAAQDDARERAAEELARRIRADLALRLAQSRRRAG
ncbi:MAG: LPS assembly lipoprotein LptE [Hyphomonadaceae bacterium]